MAIERERMISGFEAAIDQIERALRDCPDEKWESSMWPVPRTDPWVWPKEGVEPVPERTDESIQRFSAFWCVAYHALWFLDFYGTVDTSNFESPDYIRGGPEELPFPAADGAVSVPNKTWDRDALIRYAAHGRGKIRQTIESVTEAELARTTPSDHPRAGETFGEVLNVNLTHIQEHGGQMAAFVGSD